MQKDFCNCVYACQCECPEDLFPCPLDEDFTLEKNRSISRKRHHKQAKAKKKSIQIAILLCSSIDRFPKTAIEREVPKAVQALKDCKRYIRSFSEEEREEILKVERLFKKSNNYKEFYKKNVERSKHRI